MYRYKRKGRCHLTRFLIWHSNGQMKCCRQRTMIYHLNLQQQQLHLLRHHLRECLNPSTICKKCFCLFVWSLLLTILLRVTHLRAISHIWRWSFTLFIVHLWLELLLIYFLPRVTLALVSKSWEVALSELHSLALGAWHHMGLLTLALSLLIVTSFLSNRLIFLTSSITTVATSLLVTPWSTLILLSVLIRFLTSLLWLIFRLCKNMSLVKMTKKLLTIVGACSLIWFRLSGIWCLQWHCHGWVCWFSSCLSLSVDSFGL